MNSIVYSRTISHRMPLLKSSSLAAVIIFLLASCQSDEIDYNAHVKPILNKKCISCHGGVKQNGGFSLLTRDLALATTESGRAAIIPGNGSESELIKRLRSEDHEYRMPFEAEALNANEISILERWIDQGANWTKHWAYRPLQEIKPPSVLWSGSTRSAPHPIDQFVQSKLSEMGLSLSKSADIATLRRRISLDLIGIPAPARLQKSFQRDRDVASFVDSLMALPQFGEKWASMWLDLARYADSKGFERDPHRNMWRYRDWVIRAFNDDMPYDQFIIEQLAGDLLPEPSDAQLIATGFHRNTSTNDEGGTDNEEYRTYAVFDRVNTTWEGLMATTMACVQCHSHPYDPVFHAEYYQSMAIFNNTRDEDTHMDYPLLRHFDAADSSRLEDLSRSLSAKLTPEEVDEVKRFIKTWQPAWHGVETDSFSNAALYDMKYLGLRQDGSARLPQIDLTNQNNLYVRLKSSRKGGRWTILIDELEGDTLLSTEVPNTAGQWKILHFPLPILDGIHDLYLHYRNDGISSNDDRPHLSFDWLRLDGLELPWSDGDTGDEMKQVFWQLLEVQTTATPIMIENPSTMQRQTHRLERGNFLVPDEEVKPGLPSVFGPWPDGTSHDRLGFAQWMVSEDTPLTSRTWVNRIWAQLFGRGLVETLEDFGSQGAAPSHPALLDWLAWQMMHEHQWSLKRMLKQIILSETYQQQSQVSDELLERDPLNIYLSRGPRVRLSAEQIRDQALSVAGILNLEMYGPSVMPYQPVQWNIPYSSEQWKTSENGQQHRRGIYTYWKRSSPYPSMMIYDAAERSVCSSRRIQTNTPLHALVTLNDPVFVEAAAFLGSYMAGSSDKLADQVAAGYQRAFGQEISVSELRIYEALYQNAIIDFEQGASDAKALLTYLDAPADQALAGLVMVANSIMNTDAFIMKN